MVNNNQPRLSKTEANQLKNFEFFKNTSARFLSGYLKELAREADDFLSEGISHVIYHEPKSLLISPIENMKIGNRKSGEASELFMQFFNTSSLYRYSGPKMLRTRLEEHYLYSLDGPHELNAAVVLENILNFNYKRLKHNSEGIRVTPLDHAIKHPSPNDEKMRFLTIHQLTRINNSETDSEKYRVLVFEEKNQGEYN